MARLLIIIAIIGLIWYGLKVWRSRSSEQNNKSLVTFLLWGGLAVLVFLTLTGRVHWITAAIGALIPLIKSALPYLQRLLPFALQWRKTQAQQKQLVGEWVKLKINPMSGSLNGEVLKGDLKGRALNELSEAELKLLLKDCLNHELKSAQLLAAFLQQQYGSQWQASFADVLNQYQEQSQQTFNESAQNGSLSEQEAYEILGIEEGATKEEILKAYKSMMQKVHPDRGGSDYLTRLVSDAKELLIKKL